MSLFKSLFLFHIILIAALKILRTRTQGGCLISGAEGVIGAQLASGRELKGAPASTSPAGKLPLPADSQGPEFFIVRKFSWAYADATSIQLPTFVLLSGAPGINLLFVPPLCTLHELRMTIPTSALLRSFLPHETGFLEFLPSWLPSLLVEQDTDHQFPPPPLFIAVFLIMNPKIEFVCLFLAPTSHRCLMLTGKQTKTPEQLLFEPKWKMEHPFSWNLVCSRLIVPTETSFGILLVWVLSEAFISPSVVSPSDNVGSLLPAADVFTQAQGLKRVTNPS